MSCTEKRIILVTGGNKGIGFWTVKKLIEESNKIDTFILLGSRDIQRGQDALEKLGFPNNVRVLQIDTSDPQSITRAVEVIGRDYDGTLDVIINNAGISLRELTVDAARKTFATNYYGIKLLNEKLLPFLRQNGRIINVSSQLGPMTLYQTSVELQRKYTSATLTFDELDSLVKEFIDAIETHTLEIKGYSTETHSMIYGISKAALNALTQIEARDWCKSKNLLIVSVTPGFCSTDINNNAPDGRSPALGADSILHAVNSSSSQILNGAFYRDGEELPFISKPLPRDQWKNSYKR